MFYSYIKSIARKPYMKKIAPVLIIFLLFCLYSGTMDYVRSETLLNKSDFLSKAEEKVVLKGELITWGFLKNTSKVHSPNTDGRIDIPVSQYIEKELESYEMICVEKAFFKYDLSENSKLSLYNMLAAFSKLSGMKYYSRLDKKTKVLISDCHRLESPTDKKRMPDNIYTEITPETINYFSATDNRLGELVFRSELHSEGNNFIIKSVCVQPIEKFFISVNRSGEYQLLNFFIYDVNAKGYFYCAVNAMKIRNDYFLRLGNLSAGSFANRIRGNTVQIAKLLGLDWENRLKAFE
jgi:hypothetical protein